MTPTYRQRLLAIPPGIRSAPFLLFGAIGFAVGMYWWITFTGLYRWLAEMQAALPGFHGQGGLHGIYYPLATGILTLLITVLIPILLVGPFAGLLFFVFVKLELFPVDPTATSSVKLSRTDRLPQDPKKYGNEE